MKRPVYDVSLKLNVVEEYRKGGVTYNGLAKKYKIPRATIASWLLKSKKYDPLPLITNNEPSTFLNITEQVNTALTRPDLATTEEITLSINGFAVKGDLNTITRLLSGGR